ncbi:MAG: carbohydrate binding family 9 domain-containing protein, partial [Betaproteobacteria bacterium]
MLILAVSTLTLQGALPDSTSLRHTAGAAPQVVSAARTDRSPSLDGRLDDPVWQTALPIAGLRQSDPDEGRAVSESTEVRVVYDGAALYVGARLFDRDPGGIARPLARRDVDSPSDEFRVMLDSYHDHRTTFLFAVSPAGVQRDAVAGDDGDDFDD